MPRRKGWTLLTMPETYGRFSWAVFSGEKCLLSSGPMFDSRQAARLDFQVVMGALDEQEAIDMIQEDARRIAEQADQRQGALSW